MAKYLSQQIWITKCLLPSVHIDPSYLPVSMWRRAHCFISRHLIFDTFSKYPETLLKISTGYCVPCKSQVKQWLCLVGRHLGFLEQRLGQERPFWGFQPKGGSDGVRTPPGQDRWAAGNGLHETSNAATRGGTETVRDRLEGERVAAL